MKTFIKWVKNNWVVILFAALSISIVLFASLYNLSGMTNNQLSSIEVESIHSANSGTNLWQNPINLPHKLLIYLLMKLNLLTVFTARASSAIFGVIFIIGFYLLATYWFSKRTAWLASAMLLSSPLYLNFSRLATPSVLLPLGLLGIIWSAWWTFEGSRTNLKLILSSLIVVACLYIPGLVWFCILLIFLQKKHILRFSKKISKTNFAFVIIFTILLVSPLLRAFLLAPSLILQWLALPNTLNPVLFVKNLINIPLSLVARAPLDPVFNLGQLPYGNIMTSAFAILGIYAFGLRLKLVRSKTLLLAGLIAWVLISMDNLVSINLITPILYLAIAGGIMFLLQQWYSVFPKNPVARIIGAVIIANAISMSIYFNATRYFSAWVNNPVSQQQFTSEIPKI